MIYSSKTLSTVGRLIKNILIVRNCSNMQMEDRPDFTRHVLESRTSIAEVGRRRNISEQKIIDARSVFKSYGNAHASPQSHEFFSLFLPSDVAADSTAELPIWSFNFLDKFYAQIDSTHDGCHVSLKRACLIPTATWIAVMLSGQYSTSSFKNLNGYKNDFHWRSNAQYDPVLDKFMSFVEVGHPYRTSMGYEGYKYLNTPIPLRDLTQYTRDELQVLQPSLSVLLECTGVAGSCALAARRNRLHHEAISSSTSDYCSIIDWIIERFSSKLTCIRVDRIGLVRQVGNSSADDEFVTIPAIDTRNVSVNLDDDQTAIEDVWRAFEKLPFKSDQVLPISPFVFPFNKRFVFVRSDQLLDYAPDHPVEIRLNSEELFGDYIGSIDQNNLKTAVLFGTVVQQVSIADFLVAVQNQSVPDLINPAKQRFKAAVFVEDVIQSEFTPVERVLDGRFAEEDDS